jgi:hypothetical protein
MLPEGTATLPSGDCIDMLVVVRAGRDITCAMTLAAAANCSGRTPAGSSPSGRASPLRGASREVSEIESFVMAFSGNAGVDKATSFGHGHAASKWQGPQNQVGVV